jgi:hypothetical protein
MSQNNDMDSSYLIVWSDGHNLDHVPDWLELRKESMSSSISSLTEKSSEYFSSHFFLSSSFSAAYKNLTVFSIELV